MKQSKFIIALGTLALTVGAFVVTKASKKFAGYTDSKFKNISFATLSASDGTTNHMNTVKGANFTTAILQTFSSGSATNHTLVTAVAGARKVYLHS